MIKEKNDIHNDIKKKFFSLSGIRVEPNGMIDFIMNATASMIYQIYVFVENNFTPYIYTKAKGRRLNDVGLSIGCPRNAEEEDNNYRFRVITWVKRAESGNEKAINSVLSTCLLSSCVYKSLANGAGTANLYVITKNGVDEDKAIEEVKSKIENIVSSGVSVRIVIPEITYISIVFKIDNNIHNELIKKSVEKYINKMQIGEIVSIGDLTRIGLEYNDIEFFAVSYIKINDELVSNYSDIVQGLENKLQIKDIFFENKI